MFNTHFNIVTSNTFKLSTTALIGLLSLTFNATAQSQDIPHGHVIQQEKLVSPTAKGKRQQAQDNTSALKRAMADYRGASAKKQTSLSRANDFSCSRSSSIAFRAVSVRS